MPRAAVFLVAVGPLLVSGCSGGIASDWAFSMTNIRELQKAFSGAGIKIAVIDTGIQANHPSLDHVRIIWRDQVGQREAPYDDYGHGTHVASIIVGEGAPFGARSQGYNLKGAAPGAELIVVKAISQDQTGKAADVARGIDFSVDQRADVICLSLGAKASLVDPVANEINQAVDRAIARGIVVVAAAGNTGQDPDRTDVENPAVIQDVIAVGAVDSSKRIADFSARGNEDRNHGVLLARPDPHKKPEIVAPGVEIKGAWKDSGYATAKGTSQAAPFVCGAVALVLEKCPSLRSQDNRDMVRRVKQYITETAEKIPGQRTPHDNAAGYGLLDADAFAAKACP